MRRLLLLGCCLFTFFINSVFSQSRVSSADIKGTVTDQSGAVLQGVTISVISAEKGTVRQVVSDDHGQYLVPLLPPDEYQIRLEMPGFATIIQKGLTLNVGQIVALDFKMEVTGTATEVVVTSAVPIIEVERTPTAAKVLPLVVKPPKDPRGHQRNNGSLDGDSHGFRVHCDATARDTGPQGVIAGRRVRPGERVGRSGDLANLPAVGEE